MDKHAYGLRVPLTETWLTEREPTRGDVVVFTHPRTDWTARPDGLPWASRTLRVA